jgi:predicted methyltransferase
MSLRTFVSGVAVCLTLAGCATSSNPAALAAQRNAAIQAAVDSPDRPAKDREQDAKRLPADMLRFSGVAPGQKVIDLFSAAGWYAELLSRTVGPTGEVYLQNPPSIFQRMGDKGVVERLAGNRLPNAVRWDKPMNDMDLPAEHFDGAMINLVFHDFFWLSQDVDDILADLNKGLKHGAWVVVIDHSAPAGSLDSFAKDPRGQHRIDEALTKEKFLKAGFVLEAQSDLLRNAADDRQNAFFAPAMQGKVTDRFALRFRKP